MRRICLALIFLVTSSLACAHKSTDKPKHPWVGSLFALGVVDNTGNTEQTDANLTGVLQYEKGRWKNVFDAQAQLTITNKETSKEQLYSKEQLNYSFGAQERFYAYGAGFFSYNRFGPYTYQSTGGVGLGRELLKYENFKLSLQAGPALRYDRMPNEIEGKREVIGQAGINITWNILKNLSLSEGARYDFGYPYNYLNAVTSLNTLLAGHWSLLLSFAAEYYSRIPRGSTHAKKLDTTTSLSVGYNF